MKDPISQAPQESLDGGARIALLQRAWTLSDASRYVDLSVAKGLEKLPILVKVGRRYEWKLELDLQKVGVVRSCDLAFVRPIVSHALAKVGIGRTRRFGDI